MIILDVDTTVGKLMRLWIWGMNVYPEGILKDADAEDIAMAMEYKGDPEILLDALLHCGKNGCGFLEKDFETNPEGVLKFHDWEQYGGALNEIRKSTAERVRKFRERKTSQQQRSNDVTNIGNSDVTVTSPSRNGYVTVEKRREEKREEENIYTQEFEVLWKMYPSKTGKVDAQRHYIKHRKEGISYEEIQQGLNTYLSFLASHPDYKILNGSTFFGPQKRWTDQRTDQIGGFQAPTGKTAQEDERNLVRNKFGGDYDAYRKWQRAGCPEDNPF